MLLNKLDGLTRLVVHLGCQICVGKLKQSYYIKVVYQT